MKKTVLALILLFFTATQKIWSDPITLHPGQNFVKVEIQNLTFKPIHTLSIHLIPGNTSPGIQMQTIEISFSGEKSGNIVTFPVYVQGNEGTEEAFAEFMVADNNQRVWNFGITFLIQDNHFHQNELKPNFPNPFSTATEIHYVNASSGKVLLKVYNTNGQLVQKLIDNLQPAGSHSVKWDGTDHNGQPVASGIYIYELQSLDFSEKRKMILIK